MNDLLPPQFAASSHHRLPYDAPLAGHGISHIVCIHTQHSWSIVFMSVKGVEETGGSTMNTWAGP